MGIVGIIASPAAGKDVRRLVANAGSVGDADKIALVRRAAAGAVEGGATRLLVLDDSRHLVLRALDGAVPPGVEVERLPIALTGSGQDTVRAAAALAKVDAGGVLVLGGDGTCRDVAKGWRDAPMVPLAVGTNNVFPWHGEATIAGLAAGLVASGAVALDAVASPAKVIHVAVDGDEADLALVDVVLADGHFVGAGALWRAGDIRAAVFAVTDRAAVGLSAIGAAVRPTSRAEDAGVYVRAGSGAASVRVPVAPGTFASVGLAEHRRLALGEAATFAGPGVLAFDGERDHVLGPGESAVVSIHRDGPLVVDPAAVVRLAGGGG